MIAPVYRVAGVLAVLLIPDLVRFGQPFWARERGSDAPLLCLGFVAALWIMSQVEGGRLRRLAAGLATLAAVAVLVFVVTALAPDVSLSRSVAAISLCLGMVLVIGGEMASAGARLVLLAAVALASGIVYGVLRARPAVSAAESRPIFTLYHTLQLTNHGRVIDGGDVHLGGGFTRIGDRVLLMSGNSALYLLDANATTGAVSAKRLPLATPMRLDQFDPSITTAPGEAVRAQHVIGRQVGDGWQVFVSHHAWTPATHCVSMVVSTAVLTAALDRVIRDWTTLATMRPCLSTAPNDRGEGFQGLFSGGRMAWLSDDEILLTTGDHGFDMVGRLIPVSQLDDYDYGKTRIIDVRTGQVKPFTKGNRNPQGLYIDPARRIWSTEQGPRGGDELNLLVPGGNYGWPFATLGTDYSQLSWPPADTAIPDPSYIEPQHAWIPSVGLTSVVGVESRRFPRWTGNLMASSLAGRALFRLGLDGDRVQVMETIPIGLRIRDVIEAPSGDLWLWNDAGQLLTLSPAPASTRAETAFSACSGCHAVAPGAPGGIGPNLAGVVGRAVASDPSFSYSAALRSVGGRWTPARLEAFLADPAAFAPGTTMVYRVTAAEDQEAVVAFLRGTR